MLCLLKTAASRRVLALDATTVRVLRRYREEQEGWYRAHGRIPSGYVFTALDGWPMSPDYLTQTFTQLVRASGLPPVRLHDLRYGAASLALAAGVDLKVVADQLRHDCKTKPMAPDYQADVTLTLLGATLGREERHVIGVRLAPRDAVWLTRRQFFLLSSAWFQIADLDRKPAIKDGHGLHEHPHPQMRGAPRLGRQIVTATRPSQVYSINLDTGLTTFIAELNTVGCDFAVGAGHCAYLLTHHYTGAGSIPIVVRLHYEARCDG